jgi:cellulose synthase/poly-beta-1,6-N-acetylglucosamine synthase-like glycosyltransferase
MHAFIAVAFWLALFALGYLYVGYPVVSWLRGLLAPRPHRRTAFQPVVTVVVVAHDEADRIERRIANLLALDYPADRLDVVIASDGSADDTVARAQAFSDQRVVVRAFQSHRGKAAVLNDVVPFVRGDIVVLADARQQFERGSVKALVSNFADPRIGAVSGELMLSAATTDVGRGARIYWRYEKFIRRNESRADSTVGATGAICAIRRQLFERIPRDTILDDVLIPLRIVRLGYRVLFDPDARAIDEPSETAYQEFVRKTRTITGTFQLFSRERWLLNPFGNRIWFETLSHKGLRLIAPLLQIAVFDCSIMLRDLMPYGVMAIVQCAFYGAAFAGWAKGPRRPHSRFLTVPYAICLMNWATVIAFVRFASGEPQGTWERATPVPSTRAVLRSSRS